MSTLLKYPYRWGVNQVNKLTEAYPRGTKYLGVLLDIGPHQMRHLLTLLICSGNSVKWEGVKRLIKYNEANDTAELSEYSIYVRKELYRRLLSMAIDDYLDSGFQLPGLDNTKLMMQNLKGQENRGKT